MTSGWTGEIEEQNNPEFGGWCIHVAKHIRTIRNKNAYVRTCIWYNVFFGIFQFCEARLQPKEEASSSRSRTHGWLVILLNNETVQMRMNVQHSVTLNYIMQNAIQANPIVSNNKNSALMLLPRVGSRMEKNNATCHVTLQCRPLVTML